MKTSPPATTPRKRFALTGKSVKLDPRTNAVRADIADIRLADRVFAPHYAAPLRRDLARAVPLRTTRDDDSEILAQLEAGDGFEVFELAGGNAWGIATGIGLVGFIDAGALT